MDWSKILSLPEAGALYNRHPSTIRNAIYTGMLKENQDCKKLGNQWYVLDDSMRRLYGDVERKRIKRPASYS